MVIKLNLGCGDKIVDDWVNVDYSLGARLSKIPFFKQINKKLKLFNLDWDKRIYLHDLTLPFPWNNSSIDEIYSSHTLEHLSRENGQKFLQECHRVLKKDGVIRIVVPDLQLIVDRYNNGDILAENLLEALDVKISSPHGLKGYIKKINEYPHLCMYTSDRLQSILQKIGFQAEKKSGFDSLIKDIRMIEAKERTIDAVIIEGIKI